MSATFMVLLVVWLIVAEGAIKGYLASKDGLASRRLRRTPEWRQERYIHFITQVELPSTCDMVGHEFDDRTCRWCDYEIPRKPENKHGFTSYCPKCDYRLQYKSGQSKHEDKWACPCGFWISDSHPRFHDRVKSVDHRPICPQCWCQKSQTGDCQCSLQKDKSFRKSFRSIRDQQAARSRHAIGPACDVAVPTREISMMAARGRVGV